MLHILLNLGISIKWSTYHLYVSIKRKQIFDLDKWNRKEVLLQQDGDCFNIKRDILSWYIADSPSHYIGC